MMLKTYSNKRAKSPKMNDFPNIEKYEELFGLIQPKIDIEEDVYLKNNIIICKECNLPTISNGINIWECQKCGSFVEETIDATLSFNEKNQLEGTFVSKFLPNSSKSTIMLYNFKTNYDQLRKQKVHNWSNMIYSERSLNNVFTDIKLRAINNSILENITFCAQEIYMEISQIYTPRGNLRKGIIAASLYQACKKKGFPRTTKEIAEMFQIEEKILTRGNKKFNDIRLKIGKTYIPNIDDGLKYLGRFCSMLTTNVRLLEFAKIIIRFIENHKILQKHTPISITASAIYFTTRILRLPILRSRIAEVTKVSNVTTVNCYKKIKKHDTFQNLSAEFPIQKLDKLPELPADKQPKTPKRGRKKNIYV